MRSSNDSKKFFNIESQTKCLSQKSIPILTEEMMKKMLIYLSFNWFSGASQRILRAISINLYAFIGFN